jgi:hypothetical protein
MRNTIRLEATKQLCKPHDFSTDYVTAGAFHYLVLHLYIIAKPDNSLLIGRQNAACNNFNQVVKKVIGKQMLGMTVGHGLEWSISFAGNLKRGVCMQGEPVDFWE